jgi:sporulation protein YlmC with PRC-barrel domain
MDAQLWKAGVVVVLGLVAALAPARVEAAAEGAQPLRAQQVIGREALNSAGRETGWVEDLLVDIDARRIEALVVAHDGRSIKVPAQGARYEEDRVRLAQDERTLDRMRRWNGRPEAGLVRVKSLLEQPLQSREGDRDIATVKDLLLDLPAGRVTHVVLDFEEGRKAEAGWVAVAADSVREGPGGLRAAFDPKHLYAPDEARRQAAAAAPPPPPRIVAEDVRLSRIVGQPVKGTDGATLGRVAAVHLDRAGRRIAALRVEQDGEGYDCSLRADGLVLRRDAVESVKPAESLASAPCAGVTSSAPPSSTRRARWRETSGKWRWTPIPASSITSSAASTRAGSRRDTSWPCRCARWSSTRAAWRYGPISPSSCSTRCLKRSASPTCGARLSPRAWTSTWRFAADHQAARAFFSHSSPPPRPPPRPCRGKSSPRSRGWRRRPR